MTVAATYPHQAMTALRRMRVLTRALDTVFRVPGTSWRFGLDGVLGFIPVVGDAVPLLFSAYIVWEAKRLGIPRAALRRMVLNIALDAAVGAVPVLGDVFDFAWKANVRNMKLVEKHLEFDVD